jgi:hypothetical protein
MQEPERIIDVVGCSEQELARLRLLFRMGAARFRSRWRFSDSEPPDLMLVDPQTPIGAAAREIAHQVGRTSICIVDLGVEDDADWALRRPLKLDAIVRMVNLLCAAAPPPTPAVAKAAAPVKILAQGENFFDLDLGDADTGSTSGDDGLPGIRLPEIVRGFGAHDVDALFRRDPNANNTEVLLPHRLRDDTAIEHTEAPTLRTTARQDGTEGRIGTGERQLSPNIDPSLRRNFQADTRAHPLVDFLTKSILGSPSRIQIDGLPALVLDPVNRCYHAKADLPALELYCLQDLSREAFKPLTSAELTEVRISQPAKPWLRLQWLARYLVSEGRLSCQLDPGGKFKLERSIELARDYPTAYRISTTMLRDMQALHEIAKHAEASMTDVINVVNAYEAVNLLEAQLRDRFR